MLLFTWVRLTIFRNFLLYVFAFLILSYDISFNFSGRSSRMIFNLHNFFSLFAKIVFHALIMRFSTPVFTNNKNIGFNLLANRNVIQFMIWKNNIHTAKCLKHFYSLLKWNSRDIGFVQFDDFIRSNANSNRITQSGAIF